MNIHHYKSQCFIYRPTNVSFIDTQEYIHTHIYTYTYKYIYLYICVRVYVCVLECVFVCLCVNLCSMWFLMYGKVGWFAGRLACLCLGQSHDDELPRVWRAQRAFAVHAEAEVVTLLHVVFAVFDTVFEVVDQVSEALLEAR